MSDIDDLYQKIDNLQQEINKLSPATEYIKPVNSKTSLFSFLPKVNVTKLSKIYYAIIPLTMTAILFFVKPSFIMENDKNTNKNTNKKKIDYKKLLISTLISSLISAVVIFAYFYKKK